MAVMGFRAFLVMDIEVARQAMAENGGKWQKMVEKSSPRLFGRKWCFRVFPVVAIEVAGQAMAGNGGKKFTAVIW